MSNIIHYLKKYANYIIIAIGIIAIKTFLVFLGPLLIRELLETVEVGNTEFTHLLYAFLFAFVGQYVFTFLYNLIYFRFSYALKTTEIKILFSDLFKVNYSFVRKLDPTYFVNRIKGSVDHIFNLVGGSFSKAIISLTTIIISLYLIFNIHYGLFILFLILLPLNYYSYKRLNQKLMQASNELQTVCAAEFKNMINVVQNIEEIKQIYNYNAFVNKIGKYSEVIEKKNNEVGFYAKVVSETIAFVINLIRNAILLLSIYFYLKKQITFADIMFINMILSIYFSSLGDLNNINLSLRDVRASFQFVENEIKSQPEIDNGEKELITVEKIDFDIDQFSYDGDKVILKDINLSLDNNEKIAIIGKSGCGKSTIARLLQRFYEVGNIYINGTPLEDYSLKSLREKVYMITQNPYLFPGTIRENIVIGLDSYDENKLKHLIQLPFFEEFCNLAKGLDTEIREGGSNFSGGQKQKITILRMLMHDPDVIIFDESTSALDGRSETEIFDSINQFITNKLVLIISHRLSTVKNADRIIVLKDGSISQSGSYEELRVAEGEFNDLFASQIS